MTLTGPSDSIEMARQLLENPADWDHLTTGQRCDLLEQLSERLERENAARRESEYALARQLERSYVELPEFASDVPTFKGNNRYNYRCFLLSMELYFELNSYYFTTDDRKVRSATQKLSERIQREWLENQQYIARPYRWQDFDTFLLRQLANPDAQRRTTQAYRKYYLASQRENQSVREFAIFAYELEMWLEEEFNDQRRINYLDPKVLSEVRQESFKYQFNVPTNYTDFVWHLQSIENTIDHRRDAISTKSRRNAAKARAMRRRRKLRQSNQRHPYSIGHYPVTAPQTATRSPASVAGRRAAKLRSARSSRRIAHRRRY